MLPDGMGLRGERRSGVDSSASRARRDEVVRAAGRRGVVETVGEEGEVDGFLVISLGPFTTHESWTLEGPGHPLRWSPVVEEMVPGRATGQWQRRVVDASRRAGMRE